MPPIPFFRGERGGDLLKKEGSSYVHQWIRLLLKKEGSSYDQAPAEEKR